MNNVAVLIGRILLSAIFIQDGIVKAMTQSATLAMLTKLALPNPPLAYAVMLAIEVLGGGAILLGWKTRWAALMLAAWCVATAIVAHYHPGDKAQMVHFMKNISLAGGFLALFAAGAGRFSLDRRQGTTGSR